MNRAPTRPSLVALRLLLLAGSCVAPLTFSGSAKAGLKPQSVSGDIVSTPSMTISKCESTGAGSEGSHYGRSVAAGDLNGDGYDDLLLTSGSHSHNHESAMVLYGGPGGLGQAQGLAACRMGEVQTGDYNADGYDDAAFLCRDFLQLFLGGPQGLDLTTDSWSVAVPTNAPGYALGRLTSADVSGDGIDDLIVGTGEGVEVFHGSPLLPLPAISAPGLEDQVLGLTTIEGSGLAVAPVNACAGGNCRWSIASGAPTSRFDANGDGQIFEEHRQGLVLVSSLTQGTELLFGDVISNTEFGYSLGNAEDVNGDGYKDLLVSSRVVPSPYWGQPALSNPVVYLYLGTSTGLASDYEWSIEGIVQQTVSLPPGTNRFGVRVGSAGDLNHDGYGDIYVADDQYDTKQRGDLQALGFWGRAYVWYGGPATPTDPSGLAGADLSNPDLKINGGYTSGWGFGSAHAVGDFDGDGGDDLALGDPRYATSCPGWNQTPDVGAVRVYMNDIEWPDNDNDGVGSNEDCDDSDPSASICNTLVGSDVVVDCEDGSCSVEFPDVTNDGYTHLDSIACPSSLPVGYSLALGEDCTFISTTATFEGDPMVCMSWAEGTIPNPPGESTAALLVCDENGANCQVEQPWWLDVSANSLCVEAWEPAIVGIVYLSDADYDGVDDDVDLCPMTPDPFQLDSDGDGIGNGCDNCSTVYNPLQLDLNADQIGDACHPRHLRAVVDDITLNDCSLGRCVYPVKHNKVGEFHFLPPAGNGLVRLRLQGTWARKPKASAPATLYADGIRVASCQDGPSCASAWEFEREFLNGGSLADKLSDGSLVLDVVQAASGVVQLSTLVLFIDFEPFLPAPELQLDAPVTFEPYPAVYSFSELLATSWQPVTLWGRSESNRRYPLANATRAGSCRQLVRPAFPPLYYGAGGPL